MTNGVYLKSFFIGNCHILSQGILKENTKCSMDIGSSLRAPIFIEHFYLSYLTTFSVIIGDN